MSANYCSAVADYARFFLNLNLDPNRAYSGLALSKRGFEFMPGFLQTCEKAFPNGLILVQRKDIALSVEPVNPELRNYTAGRISQLPGFDIKDKNSIDQLILEAERKFMLGRFNVVKLHVLGMK